MKPHLLEYAARMWARRCEIDRLIKTMAECQRNAPQPLHLMNPLDAPLTQMNQVGAPKNYESSIVAAVKHVDQKRLAAEMVTLLTNAKVAIDSELAKDGVEIS